MSVDQVLAHLNVAYDLTFYARKISKPSFIAKFLLSKFVKPKITNEIPYKQSLPTSPVFIADERNFEEENQINWQYSA